MTTCPVAHLSAEYEPNVSLLLLDGRPRAFWRQQIFESLEQITDSFPQHSSHLAEFCSSRSHDVFGCLLLTNVNRDWNLH